MKKMEPRKYCDHIFNIIIIGDSCTGKSSLMSRFVEDNFSILSVSTVGVDFKIKTIKHRDKFIKLKIFDTAGQERFRALTSGYYRNIDACILVYDVTSRSSFDNVEYWLRSFKEHATKSFIQVVVGNKIDRPKIVDSTLAKELADEWDCKFFQTSAKENIGVEKLFTTLVDDFLDCAEQPIIPIIPMTGKMILPESLPEKSKPKCC